MPLNNGSGKVEYVLWKKILIDTLIEDWSRLKEIFITNNKSSQSNYPSTTNERNAAPSPGVADKQKERAASPPSIVSRELKFSNLFKATSGGGELTNDQVDGIFDTLTQPNDVCQKEVRLRVAHRLSDVQQSKITQDINQADSNTTNFSMGRHVGITAADDFLDKMDIKKRIETYIRVRKKLDLQITDIEHTHPNARFTWPQFEQCYSHFLNEHPPVKALLTRENDNITKLRGLQKIIKNLNANRSGGKGKGKAQINTNEEIKKLKAISESFNADDRSALLSEICQTVKRKQHTQAQHQKKELKPATSSTSSEQRATLKTSANKTMNKIIAEESAKLQIPGTKNKEMKQSFNKMINSELRKLLPIDFRLALHTNRSGLTLQPSIQLRLAEMQAEAETDKKSKPTSNGTASHSNAKETTPRRVGLFERPSPRGKSSGDNGNVNAAYKGP